MKRGVAPLVGSQATDDSRPVDGSTRKMPMLSWPLFET